MSKNSPLRRISGIFYLLFVLILIFTIADSEIREIPSLDSALMDDTVLDVSIEEVTKESLEFANKIIFNDGTEINKNDKEVKINDVVITTSNKAEFITEAKWSYVNSGFDTLDFPNGFVRETELCFRDNNVVEEKDLLAKQIKICYPPSYVEMDAICYDDCLISKGCKDGKAIESSCKIQTQIVNVSIINSTTVIVKYPNEKESDSKKEYAYDPSFSYVFTSTACNSPYRCINVTMYENNMTLNVTTEYKPPVIYLPMDFGNVSADGYQLQDLASNNLAYVRKGTCGNELYNISVEGTPYSWGKGLITWVCTTGGVIEILNSTSNFFLAVQRNTTFSFWFYNGNTVNTYQRIANKQEGSNYNMILVEGGTTGNYMWAVTNINGVQYGRQTSAGSLNKSIWNHIVVTIDTFNNIQIYINSVNQSTTTDVGWGFTDSGAGSFILGGLTTTSSGGGRFKFDEFAEYDYILPQVQITKIYQQGLRATRGEYQFNVSQTAGYNRWNVSTVFTENNSITNSIRAWNSTSVFNPYVATTSNNNAVVNSSNATFNFFFTSTNASRYFLMNNINIITWYETEGGTTPSTCPLYSGSGNWNLSCSCMYNVTSTTTVLGNLYLNDAGMFTISSTLNVTGLINKTSNCVINKTTTGKIIV
jgi:hypothetical protein